MKLYDIPNNKRVRLLEDTKVPPYATPLSAGTIVDFKHIDGMYSLCILDGEFVHPAAWTEAEEVA